MCKSGGCFQKGIPSEVDREACRWNARNNSESLRSTHVHQAAFSVFGAESFLYPDNKWSQQKWDPHSCLPDERMRTSKSIWPQVKQKRCPTFGRCSPHSPGPMTNDSALKMMTMTLLSLGLSRLCPLMAASTGARLGVLAGEHGWQPDLHHWLHVLSSHTWGVQDRPFKVFKLYLCSNHNKIKCMGYIYSCFLYKCYKFLSMHMAYQMCTFLSLPPSGAQELDRIRLSTYRTACKLRFVQKKCNCKYVRCLQ